MERQVPYCLKSKHDKPASFLVTPSREAIRESKEIIRQLMVDIEKTQEKKARQEILRCSVGQ